MNLKLVREIGNLPPQDPSDFYDALFCASLAVLLAESGDESGAEAALMEAHVAASGAFPAGSPQAGALGVLLDAAASVREVTR